MSICRLSTCRLGTCCGNIDLARIHSGITQSLDVITPMSVEISDQRCRGRSCAKFYLGAGAVKVASRSVRAWRWAWARRSSATRM